MQIRFLLSGLFLLFMLVGCASPPPKMRVLWPPPPDPPRLEFLGTYASQNDFEKTALQKSSEAFLGTPKLDFFKTPMDGVIDSKGRAYVSDLHLGNVRVYDFAARTNHLLTEDASALAQPLGMAIDSRDRLYVADGVKGKIIVFGADHQIVQTIGHDELVKPAYLFVDESKDRLYVTDGKASKVLIFDLAGNLLKTFGQGKIFFPQGIAVSSDGRIFVAEALMARISIFSPQGEFLEFFGERGDAPGQFDNPKDIAFGPDGMLFIIDARKPGLLIYDKDLQALLVFSTARSSVNPLTLDSPGGLFVSADGRIMIVDRLMKRFSLWQYLTPQYLAEKPVTAEDLQRIEAATKAAAKPATKAR